MTTHSIPTHNVASFVANMTALIAKANKLGVVPPTFTVGETKMVEIERDVFVSRTSVEVQGNAPKLNGWSFVGTVDAIEGNTVLRSVPGNEIPAAYRDADPCNCDHCKINRRRNSTFIVKSDSGEFKQVGRSCLRDFLGHQSPEQIAAYAKVLAELSFSEYDEDERMGSRANLFHSTVSVVAAAIRAINLFGYQKTEDNGGTRDTVATHMFARNAEHRLPVVEEDVVLAKDAIVWMQKQSGSEFMLNLAAYAAADAIPLKAFGYVAAGAMMFLRTIETKRATTANVDINNDAIANIGDKVTVKATVITAHVYNRPAYHYYDNGVSQVLMLKTEDGKLIKMFSSNMEIKQDQVVTLTGKIKSHEMETYEKSPFNGCMVTMMAPRARLS